MAQTTQTPPARNLHDVKRLVEIMAEHAQTDGVLDFDGKVAIDAVGLNLYSAVNGDKGAIVKAAFCLGRVCERFSAMASKKRRDISYQAAVSHYRELARELCADLAQIVTEA